GHDAADGGAGSRTSPGGSSDGERSGREVEVALEGVVPREGPARDPVAAAVAAVAAGLRGVDGRTRDRAEDRPGEGRRLAGRPNVRIHLGLDERAQDETALAALDGELDLRSLHAHDLADQAGQVRDGATELAGEELQEDALLLVTRSVVDEHDRGPRLRDEDVLRDVGGDRHREPAHVDALDRSRLDAP